MDMSGSTEGIVAGTSSVIDQTDHSTIQLVERNGREVIVKRSRSRDARAASRWRREVDALKAAGVHESIAQLLDCDTGELSITLRFEPGQSLNKGVDSAGMSTLQPPESRLLLQQMAGALLHLHARSLVHDDVKPENIIWIATERRAVLVDFGAALDFTCLPPDYFHPSGTPSYAPPEFLKREKGPKADIWALGVVILFTMGYLPLPDGNWLLPAALEEGEERSEMLRWLNKIETLRSERITAGGPLSRMLAADPEARVGSRDLLEQLRP